MDQDSNHIFNEILTIIKSERGKYNFPITRDTTLHKDLGIYGDDVDDFFNAILK